MSLSKTDPRCLGTGCEQKEECARYVLKDDPGVKKIWTKIYSNPKSCFFLIRLTEK